MYLTYYIISCGQPRNGIERHTDLQEALAAWKLNRGALYAGSGGKSVLEDVDTGEQLIWFENCNGGYVTGELSHLVENDAE
jgi:hypothetical protein